MRIEFIAFGIMVCIAAVWRLATTDYSWGAGVFEVMAFGLVALVAFAAAFQPPESR